MTWVRLAPLWSTAVVAFYVGWALGDLARVLVRQ